MASSNPHLSGRASTIRQFSTKWYVPEGISVFRLMTTIPHPEYPDCMVPVLPKDLYYQSQKGIDNLEEVEVIVRFKRRRRRAKRQGTRGRST